MSGVKRAYCGECCHFKHEDTDGFGWCYKLAEFNLEGVVHCSDPCICDSFVSCEDKRHHMAMLRKCQRCLKNADNKDMDVKAIGAAIDFCVDYLKSY